MRCPAFIKAGKKINILFREKYCRRDFFRIAKFDIIAVRVHAFRQYIFACLRIAARASGNQPGLVFIFNNLTRAVLFHIIIL